MINTREHDKAREVAERIARRLESANGGDNRAQQKLPEQTLAAPNSSELGALRQTLAEIKQRLAHIESHITHDGTCTAENDSQNYTRDNVTNNERVTSLPTRLPFTNGTYVSAVTHPSQERFRISEAVSELVDYFEQDKTCELEPGGKPCDHCSMCNSRGF